MIASVRGEVTHVGLDHVVVEVGGVGMFVHTTPTTASGSTHEGRTHPRSRWANAASTSAAVPTPAPQASSWK